MPKSKSGPMIDETVDTLFQGKLSVIQRTSGYRFSIDALLLAHFVAPRKSDRVIDLGAGSGVIALMLAALHPAIEVLGVELQAGMAARARRSAELNGLTDRVKILDGDVRAIDGAFSPAEFDVVLANPPYRAAASGRMNPDAEKRLARHEIEASLSDFVRAADYLLGHSGKIAVVYPATRLVDLLVTLREHRLEPKRLRLVHSFAGGDASLALVEGSKEGRSEVKILPPLTIYTEKREYTPEVSAMLSGMSLPRFSPDGVGRGR
jgi:tRNA1Val (adenine37-N6)-methyltransferase